MREENNIPLKAIMTRIWNNAAKTPHQINTHIIKGLEQAVLDALDTVALNRK
ncbi:hypothetical protein [Streptococcus mitis]|uniref:hypothetical protein n=1 Tax=Streptococcus mitis TaxID=28037 RepID=UPI000A70E75F|nr:hypothetical protein [Streptococcus mitis]